MALEGQESVVVGHAAAVVGDANQRASTDGQFNLDPGGAGVQGVFNQFLDDGGWALDHLAGGDSIDDMVRKDFDSHYR